MATRPDPAGRNVTRQIQHHLDGLKSAGIEYLAKGRVPAPLTIPSTGNGGRSEQPVGTNVPTPLGSPVAEPLQSSLDDQPADVPAMIGDRRKALELMAEEISSCPRCPELFSTRTQTVFGVGPLSPEICFVGEAPGGDEDRLGEPFVGAAGQLLNKIIAAMGMQRAEVYICNTLKCRPPKNRQPKPEEVANCRGYFERQLALVQPKYIVCLGSVAAQNVLGTKLGITRLRNQFHQYRGIPVLCTFHPAALLRNPGWKREVWEDMQLLLKTMGRPIPKSGGAG